MDAGGDVRSRAMVHTYTIGYMQEDPLSALLQLHLAVHVLDADARDEQITPTVLRLGGGLVSASYLLIGLSGSRDRQRYSCQHGPSWSTASSDLGFPARHRPCARLYRRSRLRDRIQRTAPSLANISVNLGPAGIPSGRLRPASCCSSAPWASRRWFRCTSGCRLRWKADPISALIHAATMVTAGIFMVSRMSPLFECRQRRCPSC